MLLGRGADWRGSSADPAYYNRVLRLGSVAGGAVQVACLLVAGAVVAMFRLIRRLTG
jgi:hypothetical protein